MTNLSYTAWLSQLAAHFEVAEEFPLARAIYNFFEDYDIGLSPSASYAVFDTTVRCCEELV